MAKMKVIWNGKSIGNQVEIDVGKVERKTAEQIADDARKLAPVEERSGFRGSAAMRTGASWKSWIKRRPGALRDSIKVVPGKWGGYLVTVGGHDEFYATFIELGAPAVPITIGYKTAPIDGRPFMRPAAWRNRNTFKRNLSKAVDKATR